MEDDRESWCCYCGAAMEDDRESWCCYCGAAITRRVGEDWTSALHGDTCPGDSEFGRNADNPHLPNLDWDGDTADGGR